MRFLLGLVLVCPALAIDFERDVEPIFHERCFVCHAGQQQMSGLRLDQKEAALKGGYSGPIIVPGDSGASKLIERVTSEKEGFRMPPVGPPLEPAQVAALRAWIDAGADWPDREPAPQPTEEERISHWSFQPIERPEPPTVEDESSVRNAIDRFVVARLESEGLTPAPDADKTTLARRVYLDLIGLPPTPEQLERFLTDKRPDAYERLVDELLRSPHYGEKQALHWLDAARYADSEGYERDPLRPHAWRWREWVIRAFNDDIPFDRFTVEQLAGDLAPGASVEQRVATGFLRNGVKNREAGVMNQEKRFEEVLDRINTVGTVWMGLTVGCAQCHDHKYDPLSQKEFYELYAFFDNAVERDIDAPLPGLLGPYLFAYPEYQKKRQKILEEYGIAELQAAWQDKIRYAMDHPGENTDWDFNTTEWRAAHDRPDWKMRASPDELSKIERDELTDWFLSRPGPEFEKIEAVKERVTKAKEAIAELEKELPEPSRAYAMIEREEPAATHIALRGDWRSPGLEVEPGVPAVLPELDEEPRKPLRLEFAEWLVSDDNPLTPRVTVNRVWEQYFGRGLVRTVDDFGTQGEKPSHPELLDWLASELVDSGWSMKDLHRVIVTSATYRQSSDARPQLSEADPENKLLARQVRLRLPAELIRDRALAASGLLNDEVGGKSVYPPQPEGIAELSYSKKAWPEDTGPDRYRRGMYIFFRRTSPYPFLTNFDAPSTLVAAVERERSNTPLQALNLLNDPVFYEAAQALAVRVVQEREEFPDRLSRMFLLALSRPPEPIEKDRVATYFAKQREDLAASPDTAKELAPYVPPGAERPDVAAWTAVARGLMNLDEFVVRE